MNLAPDAPEESHAVPIGARFATDRWGKENAVEFKGELDHLRFEAYRPLASFTMAVWERIDGFDRVYNSLISSHNWRLNDGDICWNYTMDGKLWLAISGKSYPTPIVRQSEPLLGQQHLGKWISLVCTYEAASNEVGFRVDGEQITMPAPKNNSARVPPRFA